MTGLWNVQVKKLTKRLTDLKGVHNRLSYHVHSPVIFQTIHVHYKQPMCGDHIILHFLLALALQFDV